MSYGLASCADRLGNALLLQRQHSLEHREGCGLRLHRLLGHELRSKSSGRGGRGVMNTIREGPRGNGGPCRTRTCNLTIMNRLPLQFELMARIRFGDCPRQRSLIFPKGCKGQCSEST